MTVSGGDALVCVCRAASEASGQLHAACCCWPGWHSPSCTHRPLQSKKLNLNQQAAQNPHQMMTRAMFGTASTRSATRKRQRGRNIASAIFPCAVETSAFCLEGVPQTRVRRNLFGGIISAFGCIGVGGGHTTGNMMSELAWRPPPCRVRVDHVRS